MGRSPSIAAAAPPPKPPEAITGARRPSQGTSSPKAKGDRESQQAKKKVPSMDLNSSAGLEEVMMEDVTHEETMEDTASETQNHEPTQAGSTGNKEKLTEQHSIPNAWTSVTQCLFGRHEKWYIADSDSEDVAESSKEEDDELDDDDDPMCPSVLFTAAEKIQFRREWRSALVVKGLDRRISFLPLARRLNLIWAKQGNIQISDLNNGCFLVCFREKSDYEITVIGGPWMLGDTYLTVRRWHKGFDPWNAEVKKIMVCVQLPDLPVEFYQPTAVTTIASRIGAPVRVDRATEEGARTKYARVCVEIDLTKSLLSKFKIEGKRYFIGYEGLNDLCNICGRFGAPTT
ncbi:hypothetical protein LINGRAHAP2_LOCUS19938 [Linum grandiflorum]